MLTPSQIAEMAAVKYPFITDVDPNREEYFNRHITAQQSAYIAAFTDAMELMSKEWVSVDTPPVDASTLPEDALPQWWQCATEDDILLLPCEYHKGKWHPYGVSWIEDRIKCYRPLPEPPVLTKDNI